jgi:hypothetical protein
MHPLQRRVVSFALTSFFVASLNMPDSVAATQPIHTSHPLRYGAVIIDAHVPAVLDPLPFFELSPIAPPTQFVSSLLDALPYFPLVAHDKLLVATNGEVVRAFVDPQSGDATFVPDLNRPHTSVTSVAASQVAQDTLAAESLIPHDATQYRLSNEIPVWGSAVQHRPGSTPEYEMVHDRGLEFTFVAVQRYAAGHPIYGKGSRMLFSISPQGKVVGFLRRWKSAVRSTHLTPVRPQPQMLVAEIRRQLHSYTENNTVHVDSIEEAYYDNNQRYLQPVLRYSAVITPRNGSSQPGHIYGYLPLCKFSEPIPTLLVHQAGDEPPLIPQRPDHADTNPPLFVQESKPDVNDLGPANRPISLGEYANKDANMLDMARDFRDGLAGTLGGEHIGTTIDRTQWFVAQPWEATTEGSQSFLNSVNIAYSQSYGDWYHSAGSVLNGDPWSINTGNVRLGAAAGGRLATWVIDASNVVPSYDDAVARGSSGMDAFTPWFSVFAGLHNAVGFRSQMWLHDGLNVPFSQAAGLGLDINASWFQEIAADSNYNGDAAYYEPLLKRYMHFGRASVFVDTRNCGHSIYDVEPQTQATVLWNFWMGD